MLHVEQMILDGSEHGEWVALLDAYARDPMGGGDGLQESVRQRLASAIADVPGAVVLVARWDGKVVGIATAFMGFSTFAARPLLNVHDIAVLDGWRGRGVGSALLRRLEEIARQRNCCKMTLEVLANNHVAQTAYRKSGFAPYELDPTAGGALFWQKMLS